MVIVVKTQMYALPNTPYNYKISSNISLLFYKCRCLDLRFQTTPFRGWCRRSQILLYLELYNLEILQPKLHYLHFQFLRICKKHDTRIFPSRAEWPELTLECESSKSMFPTFDPHQLLARLSILGKQQQCCYSVPKSWANIFPEKWHRTPQQHQGIKAEWKDRKRTRYHTSLNKTRST